MSKDTKLDNKKIGQISIFKGDGSAKNDNAYRIVRLIADNMYIVTKFFDLSAEKQKSTIKYHFGVTDGDYPLESTWNMTQSTKVDCVPLRNLAVLQLSALKKHIHIPNGERAKIKICIGDILAGDATTLVATNPVLYFSTKTGKFRLFISASPTTHLIIKFDEKNGAQNFTVKYRDDTIEDITQYYSGKAIPDGPQDKDRILANLYPVICRILRELERASSATNAVEKVTPETSVRDYKVNWLKNAGYLMSEDCSANWLTVVDQIAAESKHRSVHSKKLEPDLSKTVKHTSSRSNAASKRRSSGYEKNMIDDLLASGITEEQLDSIEKLINFKIKANSSRLAAEMRAKKIINSKKRGVNRVFHS